MSTDDDIVLYLARTHYPVHKRAPLDVILSHFNVLLDPSFFQHFNMLFLSLPKSPKWLFASCTVRVV